MYVRSTSRSLSLCWTNACPHRQLAQASSVDDRGRDTDTSFAHRREEEVGRGRGLCVYHIHVNVALWCIHMFATRIQLLDCVHSPTPHVAPCTG